MGIYTGSYEHKNDYVIDNEEAVIQDWMKMEMFAELCNMSEEKRRNLLESPYYAELRNALLESGLINKISIFKLTKDSDLERRNSQAVMALARSSNDELYRRYTKLVQQKNALKDQLMRRYGAKAALVSKKAQREYIKANPITNYTLTGR